MNCVSLLRCNVVCDKESGERGASDCGQLSCQVHACTCSACAPPGVVSEGNTAVVHISLSPPCNFIVFLCKQEYLKLLLNCRLSTLQPARDLVKVYVHFETGVYGHAGQAIYKWSLKTAARIMQGLACNFMQVPPMPHGHQRWVHQPRVHSTSAHLLSHSARAQRP